MKRIKLRDETATAALAAQLAHIIGPGQVISLSGELGAGKSVFARAMMRALGVTDEAMPSPTFAIIQTYEGEGCSVAHMDWYRLHEPEEVAMLGVHDYFEPPWIAIIEWPERAPGLLPRQHIQIALKYDDADPAARIAELQGLPQALQPLADETAG